MRSNAFEADAAKARARPWVPSVAQQNGLLGPSVEVQLPARTGTGARALARVRHDSSGSQASARACGPSAGARGGKTIRTTKDLGRALAWIHTETMHSIPPDRRHAAGRPDPAAETDQSGPADTDESHRLAERGHRADERDRIADERERLANERERSADQRELSADQRELRADERERLADEREQRYYELRDSGSGGALRRTYAALARLREALDRSGAEVDRLEAEADREAARATREQADVDREIASSQRASDEASQET